MCQTPITLPTGDEVACRKCRICIDNVTKDWVGRCLAESKTSVAAHSVTLTYGRDSQGRELHERAAVLTYSDVQVYLKRLRNNGYPVRYLIAGEYGKAKGRAHWHGIFFWQKKVPPHKLFEMFNDELWEHGHQVWKKPEPNHIKYMCKYIRKDVTDKEAQGKFVMSKVPHIGAHYFTNLAVEMVNRGIVPQGPFYRMPEARKKDGKPVEFYLRGVAGEKFAEAYYYAYKAKYPGRHTPPSEWLDEWEERQVKYDPLYDTNLQRIIEAAKRVEEAEERKAYRKRHNDYHFGRGMHGFFETEWVPDDEQETEQEKEVRAGPGATAGEWGGEAVQHWDYGSRAAP